jgi:hypothetical protein
MRGRGGDVFNISPPLSSLKGGILIFIVYPKILLPIVDK